MTPRERRLARLVALRTKQHAAAVNELQAARSVMEAAEAAILQAAQTQRDAHDNIHTTLRLGDQQGWLLACADAELCKLTVAHAQLRREQAMPLVEAAAANEAEARRELRQMETMLETVRREEGIMASRAEQQTLDETARLLSGSSSKTSFTRRVA